jgi:hypothetical protein
MYLPVKLEKKQQCVGHKQDAYNTDIRIGVGVGETHADPQQNGSARQWEITRTAGKKLKRKKCETTEDTGNFYPLT